MEYSNLGENTQVLEKNCKNSSFSRYKLLPGTVTDGSIERDANLEAMLWIGLVKFPKLFHLSGILQFHPDFTLINFKGAKTGHPTSELEDQSLALNLP